jgi:hypothetical protein
MPFRPLVSISFTSRASITTVLREIWTRQKEEEMGVDEPGERVFVNGIKHTALSTLTSVVPLP